MAHNGMLATVYFRLKQEKDHLDLALSNAPGGREAVIEEATSRRAVFAENSTPVGTPGLGTPIGTPGLPMGGIQQTVNFVVPGDGATGYVEPIEAIKKETTTGSSSGSSQEVSPERSQGLRRRSIMKAATSTPGQKKAKGTGMPAPDPNLPHGTSLEPSHNTMPHSPREPNVLSYSPNEKIAVLARNIDMMEDELRSNGAQGLVWPQNVTYRNYFEYMFFPTLVYQLEYPRTDT
jgi:sterol O-acyltransferase